VRRTERGRVKALERHRTNSSREEDNFSSPVNSRSKCMEGKWVKEVFSRGTGPTAPGRRTTSPVL